MKHPDGLKSLFSLDLNGARGRNRTTDTRIFNPALIQPDQSVIVVNVVKPVTGNQLLSGKLSNLPHGAFQ